MRVQDYFSKADTILAQYRGAIRQEAYAYALAPAHQDKAKHNLRFVDKNIADTVFNDWTIVILYYALYHSCLALLAKKGWISKDHTATILLLIKEYRITEKEATLIQELRLTKEDAELYASLKEQRQYASYGTNTLFTTEMIGQYRKGVIAFVQKAEGILEHDKV